MLSTHPPDGSTSMMMKGRLMQEFILFTSQHIGLTMALGVILILLMLLEFIRAKRNTFCIDPLAMTQLINHQHAAVIDLRVEDHYNKGHIIDAVLMPHPKKLEKYRTRPIIFVCATGLESQKRAAFLRKDGYNAYALTGGMRAWLAADMPTIKE
jgi:rhodanese-related sulfurtransferase